MTTYRTSGGDRVSKSVIDERVRKAKAVKLKQVLDEHGYFYCEECGVNSGRFDCSHTVSVDKCQKMGKTEMAWDVDNIRLLCRSCHQKHDKLV